MRIKEIVEKIKIPDEVSIEIEGYKVIVKGPKGTVSREFLYPNIDVKKEGGNLSLISKNATKREKRMIGTFKSHIKNMIKGVKEGINYKLKVCSTHFPMNVSVSNNEFIVKNFFGERSPRKLKIIDGVDVKVEGDIVIVSGIDKELVGRTASSIELLCRITDKDRRIFQDGIYIIEKDGKKIV